MDKKGRLFKIIILLAVLFMTMSAVLMAFFSMQKKARLAEIAAVAEKLPGFVGTEARLVSSTVVPEKPSYAGNVDWKAIHEIDPNVVGWLYLEGTTINYPVAKGSDNDFYLHHLIDGRYEFSGTLFIDCDAPDNLEGFNNVFYGHHMRNGTMFKALEKYFLEPDFYDTHKTFEYITPTEKYHLKIISVFQTDARSYVYDYIFKTDEAKQRHLDKILSENILELDPVEVSIDDTLMTLSTCVYSTGYARYVVVCKPEPWTDEEKFAALFCETEPFDLERLVAEQY